MRAGYTMVWFGWEMDARPGDPRLISFNNTPHLPHDMKTLR